jgi:hypothetical protein
MRDLAAEFKALRLYGMAQALGDSSRTVRRPGANRPKILADRASAAGRDTDRGLRSIRYQMHAASSRCIAIWPASTSSIRPRSTGA